MSLVKLNPEETKKLIKGELKYVTHPDKGVLKVGKAEVYVYGEPLTDKEFLENPSLLEITINSRKQDLAHYLNIGFAVDTERGKNYQEKMVKYRQEEIDRLEKIKQKS